MSDKSPHVESSSHASTPHAPSHEAPAAHRALTARAPQHDSSHTESSSQAGAAGQHAQGHASGESRHAGPGDSSATGTAQAGGGTSAPGHERPGAHTQLEAQHGTAGGPAANTAHAGTHENRASGPAASVLDQPELQPSPAATVGLSGQNSIVATQLTTTVPANAATAGRLPDAPSALPPRPQTEQQDTNSHTATPASQHQVAEHHAVRAQAAAPTAPAGEQDYHVTEAADTMTFQVATDRMSAPPAGSSPQGETAHHAGGDKGDAGDKVRGRSTADLHPGAPASRAAADAAQRVLQDRAAQTDLWERFAGTIAEAASPGSTWDHVTSVLTRTPEQVAGAFGLPAPTQEIHDLRQLAQTARETVHFVATEVQRLGTQQNSTPGSVAYHVVSSYAGMVANALRQFAYDETPMISPAGLPSPGQMMHDAGVPTVMCVPAPLLTGVPVLGSLAHESINRMAAERASFTRGANELGGGTSGTVAQALETVNERVNPLTQVVEHGIPFARALGEGDYNGAADHALPLGIAVMSTVMLGRDVVRGLAVGEGPPAAAQTPPRVAQTPTVDAPNLNDETLTQEVPLADDERPTTRMGAAPRGEPARVVPPTRPGSIEPAAPAVVERPAGPAANDTTHGPTQGPALPPDTVAQVIENQLARTPDAAGRVHAVLADAGEVKYLSEAEVRSHVNDLVRAAFRGSVDRIYNAEEAGRYISALRGSNDQTLPNLQIHGGDLHTMEWHIAGGEGPAPAAFHTTDGAMHVLLHDFPPAATSVPPVVGTAYTPVQSGRLTEPSPPPTFGPSAGSPLPGPPSGGPPSGGPPSGGPPSGPPSGGPPTGGPPSNPGRANTIEIGNERPTLVPGEITPEQVARAGRAIAELQVAGRPAGAVEAADIVHRTPAMGNIAHSYPNEGAARQANGNLRAIHDRYDSVQFRIDWAMAGGAGTAPAAFQTTNGVTFIDRSGYRGE